MKTKEIEVEGKKVTIWKMNFGFRSDFQGDTTVTKVEMKDGKRHKSVNINNGTMILNTLLYGIYESTDLGIPKIVDIEMGFTPEEKRARLKIIRCLDIDIEGIFDEINSLNTDVDEEVIKK